MGIPSVDLNDFIAGSEQDKMNFVASIGNAYENIGFVAVKNHGVNENLINDFYASIQAFFELPIEVKKQYENRGGQRGYVSFGKEHAKNKEEGDLKEFWHFGQYEDENDLINKAYPKNIICTELPTFNEIGKAAYQSLEYCGITLLKAIALHLNLNENYFDKKVINGNSILRPIHYPPITSKPLNAVRAGEHEDINLITLLVGASAEGLEVLNKKKEWIPVTALPDHIVVNVGDMLQRLTNNQLKSTTHRVVNPPQHLWNKPRYSVPFFLHPKPNMKLDCLPSCIKNGEKHYTDITAGDYLHQRLVEIGLVSK